MSRWYATKRCDSPPKLESSGLPCSASSGTVPAPLPLQLAIIQRGLRRSPLPGPRAPLNYWDGSRTGAPAQPFLPWPMPDEILYCYAIVASGTSSMDAGALRDVRGVAGAPVEAVPEERLAALVSPLPAPEWSPENVEARSADISWLGEQAVAHDRVVTWASDRGA